MNKNICMILCYFYLFFISYIFLVKFNILVTNYFTIVQLSLFENCFKNCFLFLKSFFFKLKNMFNSFFLIKKFLGELVL